MPRARRDHVLYEEKSSTIADVLRGLVVGEIDRLDGSAHGPVDLGDVLDLAQPL